MAGRRGRAAPNVISSEQRGVLYFFDFSQGVKNDTSAPLSLLAAAGGSPSVPGDGGGNMHLAGPTGAQLSGGTADPVAAAPAGKLSSFGLGLAFEGQSANDNRALLNGVAYVPPDTNGAVGSKQYVQTVNVTFAVYDKKTGARTLGPALMTSLWSGFGGLCETQNGGDPVVLFDHLANRWIITQWDTHRASAAVVPGALLRRACDHKRISLLIPCHRGIGVDARIATPLPRGRAIKTIPDTPFIPYFAMSDSQLSAVWDLQWHVTESSSALQTAMIRRAWGLQGS